MFQNVTIGKRMPLRDASAARCRQDVQNDLQSPTPSNRNGSRGFARQSDDSQGSDVHTLRALLEEEKRSELILDLKDVRLVDEEAVKLLASQESNGTKINNCPRYIRGVDQR